MPRAPKSPPQQVVIPSNSMVASAARYSGKAARIYTPNQDWQRECYRHYSICGEARFAAQFFGHALSRADLIAAKKDAKGLHPMTSGPAYDTLEALFNGSEGQEQMLTSIGVHLTIAGECYLVGRTDTSGAEVWEIVSIMEMRVQGKRWSIHYGDGQPDVVLGDDDVVIRIWLPDPAFRLQADSPFRALLPILSEIEWLTRHIFAQTSSRLAGAGLLMMPQSMSFPPPPNQGGEQVEPANEADSFMMTLADSMLTPIKDPSSPSAMVPVVVTAPDDAIDKVKLLHFWSNLDENAMPLRQEAIKRFALGMDLPPEQILGMSSGSGGGRSGGMISHWGAWQVEESTVKLHIEPMLELICNALTMGYLRPLVEDTSLVITYDSSDLKLRPDRSKEAFELYDRGLISMASLLRENGFSVDDEMDPEEYKEWLLRKIATGSPIPLQVEHALKDLGVDLDIPDTSLIGNTGRGAESGPSTADHPTRPRTPATDPASPDAPTGIPEAAALLAASDALVWRALERAGNRIRQKAGVKPPGVPAYEMHTLYQCNGDAQTFLEDAWSCAPQVLDGLGDVESTVQTLNAYVMALLHAQQPHKRDNLRKWLNARSGA